MRKLKLEMQVSVDDFTADHTDDAHLKRYALMIFGRDGRSS